MVADCVHLFDPFDNKKTEKEKMSGIPEKKSSFRTPLFPAVVRPWTCCWRMEDVVLHSATVALNRRV